MTHLNTASDIPAAASPRVEFVSQIHVNPATELAPSAGRPVDIDFIRRYARAIEDAGFDYTLLPYGSSGADSFVLASAVSQLTTRLKTIVALRPNTVFPLVAAQQLATLDQISQGRAIVHLITGGSDAEQARQGDFLDKDRRYARTREYLELLRRAWTETAPFSHAGEFYSFDDFGPGLATYDGGALPISIGGQSEPAFRIGGELADVFSFWGEPLAAFESEVARINAIAAAAGRAVGPRFWVTFRPIIAPTEELAWEKARAYVGLIGDTHKAGGIHGRFAASADSPQNVGSQRALDFASQAEVYDRALWTATASATNGQGAATALVGTPETVAAAILDYIDRGASIVSIRGYDTLNDVVDYGRYVLPSVREELAHRERTGSRGTLQQDHLGALAPEFSLAGAR